MIFDPIFTFIALGFLVWAALSAFKGHQAKFDEVIESGDESAIRDFTLKCCTAHRWYLIVMAVSITVMVVFSTQLGIILAALCALFVDRFGQWWFVRWLMEKVGNLLPDIKLPW